MEIRGDHVLVDVVLNKWVDNLETIIEDSIKETDIKVVKKGSHKFKPQGKTIFWILSASHISVHTYPEHCYFSLDCYTCDGEGSATLLTNDIVSKLSGNIKEISTKKLVRGETKRTN